MEEAAAIDEQVVAIEKAAKTKIDQYDKNPFMVLADPIDLGN